MVRITMGLGLVCVLALVGGGRAWAQAGGTPLASSDTNVPGVTAEVTECKRKDGVLTLKIRLKNGGTEPAKVTLLTNRNFDDYYVTAGSKKYFILRDTEKTPLAPATDPVGGLDARIPANGSYAWWAKYPAPSPDVKAVNVYTPIAPPIDDVPISDA